MKAHSAGTACDNCRREIGAERASRYDRNPNHDCADGHFCSVGCYDEGTGAGDAR